MATRAFSLALSSTTSYQEIICLPRWSLLWVPNPSGPQAGRTTPAVPVRAAGTAQGRVLFPQPDRACHARICGHTWDEPCGQIAHHLGKACPWSAAREMLGCIGRLSNEHGQQRAGATEKSCEQKNLSAAVMREKESKLEKSHYHPPQPAGLTSAKREV